MRNVRISLEILTTEAAEGAETCIGYSSLLNSNALLIER